MLLLSVKIGEPEMARKTLYRALPTHVENPKNTEFITEDQFESYAVKTRMGDGKSLCEGHSGTEIWYVDGPECRGYVLEIGFEEKPAVYAKTMCTFTPTHGMDLIDSYFAEVVEDYVLFRKLGRKSELLAHFRGKDSMETGKYLKLHGFEFSKKKWWQFWK